MRISSKDNPTLKTVRLLLGDHRARKKRQQSVIEGAHLLDACLKSNKKPQTIVASQSALDNRETQAILARCDPKTVKTVDDAVYKSVRSLGEGLAILAIIDAPSPAFGEITGDCLIVNGVQDAGNLGALLRSAAAVGFGQVVCTKGSAHAYHPKALRAGMGAQFGLTIFEEVDVDEIPKRVRAPLFATSSHSDRLIYQSDLRADVALIVGHEGQGVDRRLLEKAQSFGLPQPGGQESLNVGVAGSLCLYEILRQRRYAHLSN